MTRAFKYGGFIAAAVLIIFGVVAIFHGLRRSLDRQVRASSWRRSPARRT